MLWTLAALLLLCGVVAWGQVPAVSPALNVTALTNDTWEMPELYNNEFGGGYGAYIRRRSEVSADDVYWGTVYADELYQESNLTNWNATYSAWVRHNDVWSPAASDVFRIEKAADNLSVNWFLKQTAPAAIYGVRCTYPNPDDDGHSELTETYQIVYIGDWTYLNVTDVDGDNYRTGFYGGMNQQLELSVSFNDGASVLCFNDEIPEGSCDVITADEIVSLSSLQVTLQTLSGEAYTGAITFQPASENSNRMIVQFDDGLADDFYVVKLASNIDGRIYGQYIIDNTNGSHGFNNSILWILLMVVGGILVFVATLGFFAPLAIIKINENRVYRENTRIAKMKNPNAFAEKSGSFWDRLKNKFKSKGDKKDTTTDEKPQVEDSGTTKKFTDIIREKREEREYMQEYGVTSEQVAQIKQQAANEQNIAKQSFAFLRDDEDDEIASLKTETDDVSTIETGSYVEDGVTFAQLDSMKGQPDDDKPQ